MHFNIMMWKCEHTRLKDGYLVLVCRKVRWICRAGLDVETNASLLMPILMTVQPFATLLIQCPLRACVSKPLGTKQEFKVSGWWIELMNSVVENFTHVRKVTADFGTSLPNANAQCILWSLQDLIMFCSDVYSRQRPECVFQHPCK